jgi:tetratricopeptide (TPR) repeat protein
LIVARVFWLTLFAAAGLWAQQAPASAPQEQEPPEEDTALTGTKEYAFNPLQAEKELKIGLFYAKKSSWMRFREATRWNPGLAEAWLRLGECLERSKDKKGAREAFAKYLELEPEAKNAAEVKKRMGS